MKKVLLGLFIITAFAFGKEVFVKPKKIKEPKPVPVKVISHEPVIVEPVSPIEEGEPVSSSQESAPEEVPVVPNSEVNLLEDVIIFQEGDEKVIEE